jgi:hypothetical protein
MRGFRTEDRLVLSKLFGQKPTAVPAEVVRVPAPPPPGPDRAELLAAEEARLAAAIASGDEALIAPFALSASSTRLRQRAAEAIEDPGRIRELIRAARGGKDNAVHRILTTKRDARLEAERAAAQLLAGLLATAATIARHARLPYDPLYEATLKEHERRWRQVAALATAEQQASVEASLEAAREVVATHHAAIDAAAESRRAAEESIHREFAEREAVAAAEAARTALEQEARKVEQAAREAQAATDDEAARKTLGLLRQAQAALERGSTAHAERLRADVGRKLQAHPASALTPGFQRQLDLLDEKLQELRDWHAFTAAPKRAALVERMRSLVGASIAPQQLAQHIRKLQQEWRTLNPGGAEEVTAEHQQFRELANKAYEPCAAHFAEQSAQRSANREQRESILARLAAFTSSLDASAQIDWRLVMKVLSEARREWQKFAPVDQDIAAALQARFKAALDELGGRLDAEYQRNIAARGELIARAAALLALADVRTAIDGAKQLQREWTATGIVPHAKGNALWEEFRRHCNAVFERSAQEFAAQAAALSSNVERAGTLAAQLECIASLEGDALREGFKGVAAIIVEFESLELPPAQARGLTGRFQRALGRCADLREQDRAQATLRTAKGLFDAAAAVRAYAMARATAVAEEALAAQRDVIATALAGLESAPRAARLGLERHWSKVATTGVPFDLVANALALRLLCVRAEIATGRDTPDEDQGLRREHQLRRLVASRNLGNGAGTEDLAALTLEWLVTGPLAPEDELALRARFMRCTVNAMP